MFAHRHSAPPAVRWWWCGPSSWQGLRQMKAASVSCRHRPAPRLCWQPGPRRPAGARRGSPQDPPPQGRWGGRAAPCCPPAPRRCRRLTGTEEVSADGSKSAFVQWIKMTVLWYFMVLVLFFVLTCCKKQQWDQLKWHPPLHPQQRRHLQPQHDVIAWGVPRDARPEAVMAVD